MSKISKSNNRRVNGSPRAASRSHRWFYVGVQVCLTFRGRLLVPALLIFLLAGCAARSHPKQTRTLESEATGVDPIDQLVARLSASHGMWNMGPSSGVDLPQTASPEEVIKRSIPKRAHYEILSMRQIRIPGSIGAESYTAALIQTDSSKKIILAGYMPAVGWWWTRVYDTKP